MSMLKLKVIRHLQSKLSVFCSENIKTKLSGFSFLSILGVRMVLVVLFACTVMVIGFSVGAQKFESDDSKSENIFDKSQSIERNRRMMNLDIRLNYQKDLTEVVGANSLSGNMDIEEIAQTARRQAQEARIGLAKLRNRIPDAEMEISDLTASLEVLRSPNGLTKAAPGYSGEDIVRNFLRGNKRLYGLDDQQIEELNFIGESISPDSGIRHFRSGQPNRTV